MLRCASVMTTPHGLLKQAWWRIQGQQISTQRVSSKLLVRSHSTWRHSVDDKVQQVTAVFGRAFRPLLLVLEIYV